MRTLRRLLTGQLALGAYWSMLDQAVLSGLNLLIGMMFIRFSSKPDYALYSQVIALMYLTTSVQSSLINSPALSVLPKVRPHRKLALASGFLFWQSTLSVATVVVTALSLFLFPSLLNNASDVSFGWVALAAGMTIFTAWLRDFIRNQIYIEMRPFACLLLDCSYALLLALGLGALGYWHRVDARWVLILSAAIALLTTLPFFRLAGLSRTRPRIGVVWRKALRLGKWALPAGVVLWVFGNGYVLLCARLVGVDATAEVVAARLFMAPLGMVFLAWANIFRPRASRWVAGKQWDMLLRASALAVLAILVLVVAYTAAFLLAYPFLQQHALGGKYGNIRQEILIWAVFFLFGGVCSIATGVLMALENYKSTFVASLLGAGTSLPLMIVLAGRYHKAGVMLGLVIGQLAVAIYLFAVVRRMIADRRATA